MALTSAEKMRAKRERDKAAGLCARCGKEPKTNGTICLRCMIALDEIRARTRASAHTLYDEWTRQFWKFLREHEPSLKGSGALRYVTGFEIMQDAIDGDGRVNFTIAIAETTAGKIVECNWRKHGPKSVARHVAQLINQLRRIGARDLASGD